MRKSKLIKKVDNQIYFKIFLALLWSKEILLSYFRAFLQKIPGFSAMSEFVIPAILFLMFLLSYETIAERLRGADFVFVMGCILAYVASYIFFKRNRDFFRMEWINFILGALPFYFVGVALKSDDEGVVLKLLYRISCVSVIAFCVYYLFVNELEDKIVRSGDMHSAYNILPHACLTFYYMIKEFKPYKLLVFLLAAIALIMMGTRGAVLCLLVFIVLSTAVTVKFKRPIFLLSMVVVCALFFLFPGLTDGLVNTAYSIGEKFGLSTRVFDKLLSGDFTVSDSRVYLRERVLYYLKAYPFTGLGIYGDRGVAAGQYVHNLFMEIYAQFGLLLGTILMISLAVLIYNGTRCAFKSETKHPQVIVLLLMSCCFKLVVSSSYLKEAFFWLLLGYFVGLVREDRGRIKQERTPVKSKFVK